MSEEEKKAIETMQTIVEFGGDNLLCKEHRKQLQIILNLIETQQKEIESLKKENLEIRDWKYTIDTIEDLDKLKELDLIKIKGKEYISKDKIKSILNGTIRYATDTASPDLIAVERELEQLLEEK